MGKDITETRVSGRWTITTTISPAPEGSEHVATATATVTINGTTATATGILYRDPAYFHPRHWYLRHVVVSQPADLLRKAPLLPAKDESRTRVDLVETLVGLALDEGARVITLRERAADEIDCACGGGKVHRAWANRHLDRTHFNTQNHVAWVVAAAEKGPR